MLGPLFFAVEVACERLNWMLGAAKIRVCSVVYIAVTDCPLLATLFGFLLYRESKVFSKPPQYT